MDKSLWQETVRMNAHKKDLGSCDRYERGICAKEGKSISIVKGRERGGMRVHQETVKKRIH